jgi:hypothetical protein
MILLGTNPLGKEFASIVKSNLFLTLKIPAWNGVRYETRKRRKDENP